MCVWGVGMFQKLVFKKVLHAICNLDLCVCMCMHRVEGVLLGQWDDHTADEMTRETAFSNLFWQNWLVWPKHNEHNEPDKFSYPESQNEESLEKLISLEK